MLLRTMRAYIKVIMKYQLEFIAWNMSVSHSMALRVARASCAAGPPASRPISRPPGLLGDLDPGTPTFARIWDSCTGTCAPK